MSLFATHEWWSVRLQGGGCSGGGGGGGAEEFDRGSLAVCNVDNAPNGALKIVTASLQGVLRVHKPSAGGFAPDDCLLELQLDGPVLQLAPARAAPGGGTLLAVLFPRKLALLRLHAAAGTGCLQAARVAEHALKRTAANFAVGAFGAGAGRDAVCVQSFDGQLAFFEAGAATLTCRLPNSLIPGPLCYSPATDSLVTCNAAFELESYCYTSLAASSSSTGLSGSSGDGGGARLTPEWSVVLGEAALDIVPLRTAQLPPLAAAASAPDSSISPSSNAGASAAATAASTTPLRCELLVACERSLFVVAARGGRLLLQRRLEWQPACVWTYALPPPPLPSPQGAPLLTPAAAAADGLLVASHDRGLYVYQGPCASTLAWAAPLPLQPAALCVADVAGARGTIVALSDAGRLSVCYLGTGPPSAAVACAAAAPALDFAAMAEEHAQLLARIAEIDGGGQHDESGRSSGGNGAECMSTHESAAASFGLKLDAVVPSGLDDALQQPHAHSDDGPAFVGERRVTVRLLLSHLGREGLRDVRLSVSAPPPVAVSDPQVVVEHVPPAAEAAAVALAINSSSGSTQPPPVSVLVTFSVSASSSKSGSGSDNHDPSSNSAAAAAVPASCFARVVAAWQDPQSDEPQFLILTIPLPLALFAAAEPPARAAAHKLTIDTDKGAPPHMQDLFANLVADAPPAAADALVRCRSANALGLRLAPAGALVSVLVSRTGGGRYRLHSDCFEALGLVLDELLRRLATHYGLAAAAGASSSSSSSGDSALAATLQEPLPVAEVAALAQAHVAARAHERRLAAQLEARAAQLRAVQRRLLARFKDKAPAPLAELDIVMGETLDQVAGLADAAEAAQAATRAAAFSLSAGLRLLLLLARLKLKLSEADAAALEHALNPDGVDRSGGGDAEVGWEEEAEAALGQLLRSKEAATAVAGTAATAAPPLATTAAKDATRLQRLLSLAIDRFGGGSGDGSGNGGGQ